MHGAVLIDEVPGLLLWLGPDAGGLLATWPERGRRHLRVLPPDRRVRTRARAAAQNHGAV